MKKVSKRESETARRGVLAREEGPPVVYAEEEADGEYGEEAAVEHLGHEDHHEAVN